MPKINQLPSASSATAADLFAIENSSGTATKHVSGQQIKDFVTADVNAEVTDLKNAIELDNVYNYCDGLTHTDSSPNGVTFSWNADGSCHVTGTSTAIALNNLYASNSALPTGMKAGGIYGVRFGGNKVRLQITDNTNGGYIIDSTNYLPALFKIPDNCAAITIRLYVYSGQSNINETVYPIITDDGKNWNYVQTNKYRVVVFATNANDIAENSISYKDLGSTQNVPGWDGWIDAIRTTGDIVLQKYWPKEPNKYPVLLRTKTSNGWGAWYPADDSPIYDPLPYFWRTYLDTKIPAIQAADRAHCTGDSFVFITDVHWPKNAKHSPAIIKRIQNQTSVKKVFCGGDILTYEAESVAPALDQINDFYGRLDYVYPACGNHDDNGEGSGSTTATRLDEAQRYGTITRQASMYAEIDGHTYYTVKNDNDGIAYIVLDATGATVNYDMSEDQVAWLEGQLETLANDYQIVIIVHDYYKLLTSTPTFGLDISGEQIEGVLAELDSSKRDKIIAIFCGHTHYDYIGRDEYGIPIIMTKADEYADTPAYTVLGTTTEQSFDVVHIDTSNETIYLTRIGYGSDRTVTFRGE